MEGQTRQDNNAIKTLCVVVKDLFNLCLNWYIQEKLGQHVTAPRCLQLDCG